MAFPAWPDLTAHELEQRQLALWKEEQLFRRTVEARREGPPFVFYEGPPTANGRPGIHHVFSRTIKDLDQLITQLDQSVVSGDHVLIMSNGGFGGIHGKLLERLRKR